MNTADKPRECLVTPSSAVAETKPYVPPARPAAAVPIDLILDGNEGDLPPSAALAALAQLSPEVLRRYPDAMPLQAMLAQRLSVAPDRVLVTAGGDDLIDRLMRAVLEPGREFILPTPTFEEFRRCANLTGATIVPVPWSGQEWPLDAVLAAISPATAAIAIVTPNNPTGCIASLDAIRRVSAAAPRAIIVVDLAYVEFADRDITADVLELPNVVIVRTLSKAWGLAGLRVGYGVGHPRIMQWLRAAGTPYPVSGLALAVAAERLTAGDERMTRFIAQVRRERALLTALLRSRGLRVPDSQANFVLARCSQAQTVHAALLERGISVRAFPKNPELTDALRITCPGDPAAFARLSAALQEILS